MAIPFKSNIEGKKITCTELNIDTLRLTCIQGMGNLIVNSTNVITGMGSGSEVTFGGLNKGSKFTGTYVDIGDKNNQTVTTTINGTNIVIGSGNMAEQIKLQGPNISFVHGSSIYHPFHLYQGVIEDGATTKITFLFSLYYSSVITTSITLGYLLNLLKDQLHQQSLPCYGFYQGHAIYTSTINYNSNYLYVYYSTGSSTSQVQFNSNQTIRTFMIA